jgi:serine/threonine protein kinase
MLSPDRKLPGPDEKGKQPLPKASTFLGMCWLSIAHQFRSLYESALRQPGSEDRPGRFNQGKDGDAILQQCDTSTPFAFPEQTRAGTEEPIPEAETQPCDHIQPDLVPLALVAGSVVDGRYLIEKELDRGGFCVVFLARDQKLHDTPVVIKVLHERAIEGVEGDNKAWLLQRLKKEVQALARIDHPAVVRALDIGRLPDGRTFLVMQHVAGTNLRSAIPAHGMELGRVARLILQIGQALAVAHKQGVIHRDLKPENIMLQRAGDEEFAKLIDFGIATVLDPPTPSNMKSTTVVGTIGYMAPEQLEGKPTVASDIYALGVISYELVTGRLPFNPDSPFQLRELQQAGVRIKPCDLRPNLPQAAQAVILKAVSFAPRDRYASAQDFCRALNLALTGRTMREPDLPSTSVPLGSLLSALFFLTTVFLTIVISRCFLANTRDICGYSISFLLWLFCLSVGGTFTRGGQHWIERGFARFGTKPRPFSRWRVAFTFVGLLMIGAFYIALPAIARNTLHTSDPKLNGLLDWWRHGWDQTQTLAPSQISQNPFSSTSAVLSWQPMRLTDDSGRYEVWCCTSDGKPFLRLGPTAGKTPSSPALSFFNADAAYTLATRTDLSGQNTVLSDFSAPISFKTPKAAMGITLKGAGAATSATSGSAGATQAGYAALSVDAGSTPYATAVLSYRHNGATVSEVGVPASPPASSARFFVDYRTEATLAGSDTKVDIDTGFSAVNRGNGPASISFILRDPEGQVISRGTGSLDKDAHLAAYFNQLPEIAPGFSIDPSFPSSIHFGTLELFSDQPLSLLALRLTTNQRGEMLMTSTPVADPARPSTAGPIYFPQLAEGAGYSTIVGLLNTSGAIETGTLHLFADDGSPLAVRQLNGSSASTFAYSISPGGVYVLQTEASLRDVQTGWAELIPDGGTTTPAAAGILQFIRDGILVTETGIPSVAPTTHARMFLDTSVGRNTGVAIGNPGNVPLNLSLQVYQMDGTTRAGMTNGPITLEANGHAASFVDQLISGLPSGFRGVLDITAESPFAATTYRSLMNERGEILLTALPVADLNQPPPSPILFPHVADGDGFSTQFILLNGSGPSSSTLSFYSETGAPLAVGNR